MCCNKEIICLYCNVIEKGLPRIGYIFFTNKRKEYIIVVRKMDNLECIVVHAVQHAGVAVAADVYDQVVVLLVLVHDVKEEERFSRICLVHLPAASVHHVDQSLTTIISH